MIFGFNTDIRFGDTVYHVQSEAREAEHLLQTQVFVKGRCLGKQATSYAALLDQPDFSEECLHEMLKEQHRQLVEAARQGLVENELAAENGVAPAAPAATQVVASDTAAAQPAPVAPELTMQPIASLIGRGLTITCLAPSVAPDGSEVTVYLQVAEDDGAPASEAQLTCRITSGTAAPAYLYTTAGPGGIADATLAMHGLDLSSTAILVQASHRGQSASRKFALTKK